MNAPENTPAAYPINLAHEVLLKSDDAMCVDEVARAIVGKKPTKADIKPVAKLLKELADLGMTWTSAPVPAGHIMTPRDHVCGEFKDNDLTPGDAK